MASKKKKSALEELEGVSSPAAFHKRKVKRVKLPSTPTFIEEIKKGNISYVSRAITLVESTHPKHRKQAREIIEACLSIPSSSTRIGITGVPGVGKSTFIETFGNFATQQGKKVAVLAIDPSSSLQKGSILGDKTRMEKLVNNPKAFIRPSPAGDSLGGVAQKTREAIIICEAAGFDFIIIETVGVGQSETAVHAMVDFFLLLKLAGSGDELQGIKRGIIEMADAIAINKADGDNLKAAKLAKIEFKRALHLYPPKKSNWVPTVTLCSALKETGIDTVWNTLENYLQHTRANGYFEEQREQQNLYWFKETIRVALHTQFYQNPFVKKALVELEAQIKAHQISPFEAAQRLLDTFYKKNGD
ncbi:methylmalonyl Co-A mutase-associated GTPase MeaB [Flavobacteriaceae bacterium F08102]|nr:methylmalonyl Co-A mutase-associated GTPase MeaB [Flavobacteriaceae bacterium F08102]